MHSRAVENSKIHRSLAHKCVHGIISVCKTLRMLSTGLKLHSFVVRLNMFVGEKKNVSIVFAFIRASIEYEDEQMRKRKKKICTKNETNASAIITLAIHRHSQPFDCFSSLLFFRKAKTNL